MFAFLSKDGLIFHELLSRLKNIKNFLTLTNCCWWHAQLSSAKWLWPIWRATLSESDVHTTISATSVDWLITVTLEMMRVWVEICCLTCDDFGLIILCVNMLLLQASVTSSVRMCWLWMLRVRLASSRTWQSSRLSLDSLCQRLRPSVGQGRGPRHLQRIRPGSRLSRLH